MEKVELLTMDREEVGKLEKGEAGKPGPKNLGVRSRRPPYVYLWYLHRILVTCALAVGLLLFYHALNCTYSITQSIQVEGVPGFVLDYAPFVWLDEGEAYFPSDIFAQVQNTYPAINLTSIKNVSSPLTLENLDVLNTYGKHGRNVFLTSNIDVTTEPVWLTGIVPDSTHKTNNITSAAIIVNDHGSGLVDAFYMYFYAYNQGNTVFFKELGDHIGDWEHNMIRFVNGTPEAIWYSQHGNGQAFVYDVVEKKGIRPISYSAQGSHANYAIAGTHDHLIPDFNLPGGILQDYTSKGLLWDPTLSAYYYNYSVKASTFQSIGGSPVGAMSYKGRWGDQQYPDSDPKQPPPFLGFRKFVSGPTGPWDKDLNRTKVCPDNGILCIIRTALGP